MRAILALEDGRVFEGEAFGATGTTIGEIVFNTSATGFQEIITDPAHRGLLVAMTTPMIGNTGIAPNDSESASAQLKGLVIEELSPITVGWRAQGSLEDFMKEGNVIGIQGVDTRALTRHLCENGSMRACLTTVSSISNEDAVRLAAGGEKLEGADLVKDVTTSAPYEWDAEGRLSRKWVLKTTAAGVNAEPDEHGDYFVPLAPATHKAVVYDLGVKRRLLKRLRQAGFSVTVVPAATTAADVLALEPDAVILSNGPGDPAALTYIHRSVRELIGKKPIWGCGLGALVVAHALGAKTKRVSVGSYGSGPVKSLKTSKVAMTGGGSRFTVDPDSLPEEVAIFHINPNDGSPRSIGHKELPVFGSLFFPEGAPGALDMDFLFDEFEKLVS